MTDLENKEIPSELNINKNDEDNAPDAYSAFRAATEKVVTPESAHAKQVLSKVLSGEKIKVRRVLDILTVAEMQALQQLIESFDLGKALNSLMRFIAYSYGPEIDTMIENLYKHLTSFDQLNASIEAKALTYKILSMSNDESMSINKKLKILAVDDKADVLNTIKAMLINDYTVYAVTSGEMAIKFLSQRTVDLILLDIEMPGMDGHEVLRQIQNTSAKTIPVIFLTGNATIDNIFVATQSGASDFVVKPVDKDTLLEKISLCLKSKKK